MDHIVRTFEVGWVPDADSVNAPPNGLLRMDNVILDEIGALALRDGSVKISADLGGAVNNLFTVVRAGTRLRYAAAGSSVYRNGSSIAGFSGSGDVQFGSYLGQTFMARGGTKLKDDGSSVRNWGIAMTGGVAAVAGLPAHVNVMATWDSGEVTHEFIEGGYPLTYEYDKDMNPNASTVWWLNNTTWRGIIQKVFDPPLDYTLYPSTTPPIHMIEGDTISVYVFAHAPGYLRVLTMQIDVNDGSFTEDFYTKTWRIEGTKAKPAPGSRDDTGPPEGIPPEAPVI